MVPTCITLAASSFLLSVCLLFLFRLVVARNSSRFVLPPNILRLAHREWSSHSVKVAIPSCTYAYTYNYYIYYIYNYTVDCASLRTPVEACGWVWIKRVRWNGTQTHGKQPLWLVLSFPWLCVVNEVSRSFHAHTHALTGVRSIEEKRAARRGSE